MSRELIREYLDIVEILYFKGIELDEAGYRDWESIYRIEGGKVDEKSVYSRKNNR